MQPKLGADDIDNYIIKRLDVSEGAKAMMTKKKP